MDIYPLLSWIHWDPPREVFTIPIIDRPIAWYGLFFSVGFFVAYIILGHLIKIKLDESKSFSNRNISSWPKIIKYLQTALQSKDNEYKDVLKDIDSSLKTEILNLEWNQEPNKHIKEAIFNAFETFSRSHTSEELEHLFKKALNSTKQLSSILVDKLTWIVVLATIVGARLGHVFFYEWPRYKHNLLDIVKVWEGGLASHGGLIAILIGLYIFCKREQRLFPELSFIDWSDLLMIPSAFVCFSIRIGNFFNQEILGPPTQAPWGVIFGHPIDGSAAIPRHPVQLYEALVYLIVFFILLGVWKTYRPLKTGLLTGLFMILIFGSRFLLEFYKIPSSLMINESFLQTSQLLSIPSILWGIWLLSPNRHQNKSLKSTL